MRILRAADYRVMPWKNGGGETTEIAAFPDGAGLDAFDWRVSMARVATDGPFSLFPGIDRTLSLLEGEALTLSFEGRSSVVLAAATPPYAFPGDVAVSGLLTDGSVVDLNVMTRRGRWRHHVQRVTLENPHPLPRLGDLMLVIAAQDGVAVTGDAGTETLMARDTAIVDEKAVHLAADGPAVVYTVDLWRL